MQSCCFSYKMAAEDEDFLPDPDDDEEAWSEGIDSGAGEFLDEHGWGFNFENRQDSLEKVTINKGIEETNVDLGLGPSVVEKSSKMPVQRMALNDHKAGMKGLDKEKINKIIFEASKGSKFYENEKKKELRVAEKISSLREELAAFSADDLKRAKKAANAYIKEIQNERDLSRVIVHIDMDAFYAAVETRDDPSLKDIPMAVGSSSMLCTSNYAARKYGVRAAMPGFIAKKLCPQLKLVPMHMEKYKNESNQVRKILAQYDPNFCGMGLDEAYLDLTEYEEIERMKGYMQKGSDDGKNVILPCSNDMNGTSMIPGSTSRELNINGESNATSLYTRDSKQTFIESIVQEIRAKIYHETKLTASAGIAPNVMLAKVCSDMNKPNGQFYLAPDKNEIMQFIRNLAIRKVSGIGRVCEQVLNAFGVTSCKDLYEQRGLLRLLFSQISFEHFMRISQGISGTSLDNDAERKSMSTETTFSNTNNPDRLYQICEELCETLSSDLKKESLAGRNITLKLKLANFEVKTRTKTINNYISSKQDLWTVAKEILRNQIAYALPGKLNLRLMGVRVADFGREEKHQNKLEHLFLKKRDAQSDYRAGKPTHTETAKVPDHNSLDTAVQEVSAVHEQEMLICPICMTKQPQLTDINSHIDSCLNKKAIKELLQDDQNTYKNDKNLPPQPSVLINEEARKTKSQKRKSSEDNSAHASSKKKTLLNFWESKGQKNNN